MERSTSDPYTIVEGLDCRAVLPTIAETLASPRAMARHAQTPFLTIREPFEDSDGSDKIYTTSEADALHNFDEMLALAQVALKDVRPPRNESLLQDPSYLGRVADAAGSLRQSLHFLGSEERKGASQVLAYNWRRRIDDGAELYVGVTGGSSNFVAYEVMRELSRSTTDHQAYANRVHIVGLESLFHLHTVRNAAQRHGLTLLDDWDISGRQMAMVVESAQQYVPASGIHVELLCASTKALHDGIGGVPVQAPYARITPRGYSIKHSVTGAHCSPDYGTADTMQAITRGLNTIEDMPYVPQIHLSAVPKVYHEDAERLDGEQETAALRHFRQEALAYRAFYERIIAA